MVRKVSVTFMHPRAASREVRGHREDLYQEGTHTVRLSKSLHSVLHWHSPQTVIISVALAWIWGQSDVTRRTAVSRGSSTQERYLWLPEETQTVNSEHKQICEATGLYSNGYLGALRGRRINTYCAWNSESADLFPVLVGLQPQQHTHTNIHRCSCLQKANSTEL